MTDLLPIQFRGVDEGQDSKSQPPGTLLRALNCLMDKGRRLLKRLGIASTTKTIVTGGSVTSAKRAIGGSNITLCDGDNVVSYSSALGAWRTVDRPTSARLTRRGLMDSTRTSSIVDIAIYNGMLITAFVAGFNTASDVYAFVKIEDLATGRVIMPALRVNPTTLVRLLVSGTTAIIVTNRLAGGVEAKALDLTTFVLSGTSIIFANAAGVNAFDACIGDNAGVPTLYVAYAHAAGANRIQVSMAPVSTRVTSFTTSYVSASVATAVSIDTDGTQVAIAWSSFGTNLTRVALTDMALTLAVGPTTTQIPGYGTCTGGICIRIFDASNILLAGSFGTDVLTSVFATALYTRAALAIVAGSRRMTYEGAGLSRVWTVAGRWYASVVLVPRVVAIGYAFTAPMPAASTAILEIETTDTLSTTSDSPHNHVGTPEAETGWFATSRAQVINSACGVWGVAVSGTSAYVATAYRNLEPQSLNDVPISWNLQKFDYSGAFDTFRSAVIGSAVLCAGAAPCWYDGTRAFPYGFLHGPNVFSTVSGGGGSMAAGAYSYVFVYEWRDGNGILHRSPPSPPITVNVGALGTATIRLLCSSATRRQTTDYGIFAPNPISIAAYRTTVGGTVHYRLTLEPLYQVRLNDPTLGDVTLVDSKADADIAAAAGLPGRVLSTMPVLYTETGELSDSCPPALITVATHRGRLVGIDSSLRTIWFTKDSTEDPLVAPGFNAALVLSFASDKVALASLDDKLLVYGERTIDVVYGSGPDATGTGEWQVQGVQTDVGCVNAKSVVVSPNGSLFLSQRGIEMIGRDLVVAWVGKPIEDTLALFPNITSAVLCADQHEVRFTCVSADGLTGVVIAWDYYHQIWFTRKYRDTSDTAAADIPFADACLVNGVYTMVTAGGQVYQETKAHKLDVSTFVARDILLADVSPAGPMGWSRTKDFHILGTSVSNHDLTVSFARDYAVAFEQTKTFNVASGLPLEKCRVSFKHQQCRARRIRIQETSPSVGALDNGEGAIFEALAMRVEIMPKAATTTKTEQG